MPTSKTIYIKIPQW